MAEGSDAGSTSRASPRLVALGAAAAVPLAVLALVRLRPALDARWENDPTHFWLVLSAAAAATTMGYLVLLAARRRRDARLSLVALAFVASAGFLGLHALATPGVLVGPNAGFELATPVGLVLGSGFVALSAFDHPAVTLRVNAWSRRALWVLFALMGVWAALSLLEAPPFDGALDRDPVDAWQVAFAVLGAVGYAVGAAGYARLYRRRQEPLVLAVALAFALLAESLVVLAYAVNWRISWWEWHVLMLAAFTLITVAARREWHEERFSALYLEQTLAGARDVSVLFADLEGYTPFAESHPPATVARMLNAYFARLVPLLEDLGGEVHQLVGDAIMVIFNKHGDQDDHALQAARAGLELQQAAAEVAVGNDDWPRFRVGINSGEVVAGVIGGHRGHRKHGVVGDTVNLAARLEGQAPAGEVVVGQGTYDRLPPGVLVERLAPLEVKGKSTPVTAYLVRSLSGTGGSEAAPSR